MKKGKYSNFIKYILVFLISLLINHFFNFMNDDITFFSKILDKYSIFEFIKERYLTWTSRIIIEGLLINICRNIYIWRVLNSLIITLFIYSVEKIFFEKRTLKTTCIVSILFLLYPYYQMAEAGFAATTLNYFWPFTFLIYSFIPFQEIYKNKNINKKLLPTYILSFIFACNQEQAACVGLSTSILFLIYCIKKKKDIKYPLTLLIISTSFITFILTCPGNVIRKAEEIKNCYPDYINANILDKIYLGTVSTCSILISNFLIILLFSGILWIITMKQKKLKTTIKILSLFQFIIIVTLSIYRVYIFLKSPSILEAYTYGIFYYNTTIGHVFTFDIQKILVFGLCISIVLIYCIILYKLLKKESIFPMLLLLTGCGTRLIMGFSPTIFNSGSRTTIFLYFSLLFILLLLFKKYNKLFSKKELKFFKIILILFIIINYFLTFKAIPLIKNI